MAKTTKKPSASKAKTKKTTKKGLVKKAKNYDEMKSFCIYHEPTSFMSVKFTKQTVYWIIVLVVLAAVILWVFKMQIEITQIIEAMKVAS